ncbi:MAG: DUF4406 domain-containing protein [Coriobacteriia bacterium]|nr:DUF4406 domain-containing protein [Coriobacteriia bacterium]
MSSAFNIVEAEYTEGVDPRFPGERLFAVERSAIARLAPNSPVTDYMAGIDAVNAAYFVTFRPGSEPGSFLPSRLVVSGIFVEDKQAFVYSLISGSGTLTTRDQLEPGFGLDARTDLGLLTEREVEALLGTEPVAVTGPPEPTDEFDVRAVKRELFEATGAFGPLLRVTDTRSLALIDPSDGSPSVAAAEVVPDLWAVGGAEDVPLLVPAATARAAIDAYRAEVEARRSPSRDLVPALSERGYGFEGVGRMALGVVEADQIRSHHREVVYIIGPYKAPDVAGVRENIETAELAGCALMREGYDVVVPHALSKIDGHGEFDDPRWVDATMNLMERCDRVAVLPGWEHSTGSLDEIARAAELSKPAAAVGEYLSVPVPGRLYVSQTSKDALHDRLGRELSQDRSCPLYDLKSGELQPTRDRQARVTGGLKTPEDAGAASRISRSHER